MRSYPVKKNPIGSAVSDLLRYKQTDTVLLCIIDNFNLGSAAHKSQIKTHLSAKNKILKRWVVCLGTVLNINLKFKVML